MSPHTSDKIGKVKLTLEHQLSNGNWAGIDSIWSTLHTYVDDGDLKITSGEVGPVLRRGRLV